MHPQRRPRFLVDAMLGNVARDLRLLGYDAAYAGASPDAAILRRCQRERRILVTRDCALARRAGPVATVLVRSADPDQQVLETIAASPATDATPAPFSRCIECNGELRDLPREQAAAKVPDFIAGTHRQFRACPGCERVYWDGSHAPGLQHRVARLLEALLPQSGHV